MAEQFANNAQSTLSALCAIGDASITVMSAVSFPVTGDFRLLIDNELMLCTSVAGNVFSVTRGIEGTAAAAHSVGAAVILPLTAGSLATLGGGGGAPSGPAGGVLGGTYPDPDFALPIDAGSDKIINVDDPTNPQDAATKAYVDAEVAGSLGIGAVSAFYDGGGLVLLTPNLFFLPYVSDGTIIGWTVELDNIGTVSINVYKCTYAAFNAVNLGVDPANLISGTNPIVVTAAVKNEDTTLTGWTTTVTEGDIFIFVMTSCSVATRAAVQLQIQKS